jgi:hypothetical protein
MDQFAQPLFQTGFMSGVTTYQDEYPGWERQARIVVSVTLEDRYTTPMILDTGAPWCILDPEIAEDLGLAIDNGYIPEKPLTLRDGSYSGTLIRMRLCVPAEQGDDLVIEATVFVPILPPDESWEYPSFIGLDGFLSRVRFAIDPGDNSFYFAECRTA